MVTFLIGMVVAALILPITVCVTTTLYYDLRVRKEGLDLSLTLDSLGLPGADEAALTWVAPAGGGQVWAPPPPAGQPLPPPTGPPQSFAPPPPLRSAGTVPGRAAVAASGRAAVSPAAASGRAAVPPPAAPFRLPAAPPPAAAFAAARAAASAQRRARGLGATGLA